MLSKNRSLIKWSCVFLRNSRSTLSTTSDKVRQIIVQTLVCVSIHLECWLDKARAEIVTRAAVGVACQQQFGFKLWAVWTRSMWIEFAFDAHRVNANSIRIQTGSSVKRPLDIRRPCTQRGRHSISRYTTNWVSDPQFSSYYSSTISCFGEPFTVLPTTLVGWYLGMTRI